MENYPVKDLTYCTANLAMATATAWKTEAGDQSSFLIRLKKLINNVLQFIQLGSSCMFHPVCWFHRNRYCQGFSNRLHRISRLASTSVREQKKDPKGFPHRICYVLLSGPRIPASPIDEYSQTALVWAWWPPPVPEPRAGSHHHRRPFPFWWTTCASSSVPLPVYFKVQFPELLESTVIDRKKRTNRQAERE